ncbi:MAG: TPR repeat protein [Candidatus Saccharicenans subterraneus]|uniref:TPR repeat protein n=1 Tax=Candidatus Saccharicenans subterraneus TaxID=2508984 RepID=A0A3E2BN80_9BACT|nr:MAG: TPR repeat protein [Candidatus Saccharicenans subterraneum]
MEGRLRIWCCRVFPVSAAIFSLFLALPGVLLAEGQPVHNSNLERAIWLRLQGRYEDSLAILEKEINGTNTRSDAGYRANCWLNMALDYWNLGEVSRAENAFIYVRALVEELKDENLRDYASTALKIIKLYREGKNKKEDKKYQESESAFRMAIELADKKEMDEFKCKSLFQLSFTYYYQNKIDDYFNCSNEVLIIAERLKNYFEVFRALINIGNYHFHKREVFKSYDYFDRALVLAEKENLLHKEPVVLLNLAVNSYQLGLYELSEHYLERALEFYQKGEDLATTIYLLSELALSLHKKERENNDLPGGRRPQELLSTALELSRQAGMRDLEARMLNNLGYVLLEIDPEKARDLCLRSWRLGEHLKDSKVIIASINNLATLSLRENKVIRAKELYTRSLALAIKEDYWVEIFSNYYGLARCFEKLGDYKSAIQSYQKALETVDQVRGSITLELFRIGFDRGKKEIYEGLIRSLVKYRLKYQGRQADEMAFLGLNSIKARVLIEEMERLSSTQESGHQAEELNRIDRMINDFFRRPENTLDESSSSRLAELEYRYLRLREMGGQAAVTNSRNNLPNLEFIQKEVLSEDQLILDYFLGQEESYCFIISRDHFRIVRLPDEKEIERSVKLYIKLLGSTAVGEDDLRLAGSRIGRLLLPVEELASEKFSSLIIVPDGLLNNLPFETLIAGEPGTRGYLVETHSISYSPALALITRFRAEPKSASYQKELLAFGNPVYSHWFDNQVRTRVYFINGVHPPADFSLGTLPFSQKETKQLAELFPVKSYDLFLRKRASEDNLKALRLGDYRIIHFACHGLVSEKFPQRSSLVLSSSKQSSEDGFLTVREIYTLRLSSELVVLASCQSSRGSIERMEGIIGLPRVFLLAGSRAVVSALWAVNDRASEILMLDFYRGLLAGKSRAEALRQAKLKMINGGTSHPYYWAGYVLIGNPGRIY